jgi:cytochrome c553
MCVRGRRREAGGIRHEAGGERAIAERGVGSNLSVGVCLALLRSLHAPRHAPRIRRGTRPERPRAAKRSPRRAEGARTEGAQSCRRGAEGARAERPFRSLSRAEATHCGRCHRRGRSRRGRRGLVQPPGLVAFHLRDELGDVRDDLRPVASSAESLQRASSRGRGGRRAWKPTQLRIPCVTRRWSSCGAQRGQVRAGAWPAPTVSAARPAARAHT